MSAPILIISSPQAASDGSYQQLVTLLSSQGKVELQMIDRIVDGATTLPTDSYNLISILLPAASITSSLIGTLESALLAGGMLEVRGLHASEASAVEGDLKLGGLTQVQLVEGIISCTKPSAVSSAPLSLKRPAASLETISVPLQSALPLRTSTSRAAKASLWAFTTQSATSGSSTPTIDESSLLTAADLERPTLVQREDCDVKKTRKACKNCSCGLKELLLDEEEQDDLVAAGFKDIVKKGTNKDGSRKMKSGVVTSSCGSCYLGDAFRCGSCPYLGMPAFEPGQKVTIDASMDDI